MMPCPTCGGARTDDVVSSARGSIARCAGCSHHFMRTEDLPPGALESIYAAHYTGFETDEVFVANARRFIDDELRPRVAPPARVLDLGCGNGEFLDLLARAGYDALGFDVSEAAVALCRQRGLQAVSGNFPDWDPGDGRTFDAITMWDFVEHVPDPLAYLRHAQELLRPGGLVFIKTPSIEDIAVRCVSAVPQLAGAVLGSPAHVQYFRRASLGVLLARAGFDAPEWLQGRGVRKGTKGGPLKKVLARKVVSAIHSVSRDSNLLVFARSTGNAARART